MTKHVITLEEIKRVREEQQEALMRRRNQANRAIVLRVSESFRRKSS